MCTDLTVMSDRSTARTSDVRMLPGQAHVAHLQTLNNSARAYHGTRAKGDTLATKQEISMTGFEIVAYAGDAQTDLIAALEAKLA